MHKTLLVKFLYFMINHCTQNAFSLKRPYLEMADPNSSRHEKSLGLLTTRFVSLLQQAKDGVLDLKVVRIMHTKFKRVNP